MLNKNSSKKVWTKRQKTLLLFFSHQDIVVQYMCTVSQLFSCITSSMQGGHHPAQTTRALEQIQCRMWISTVCMCNCNIMMDNILKSSQTGLAGSNFQPVLVTLVSQLDPSTVCIRQAQISAKQCLGTFKYSVFLSRLSALMTQWTMF